nr:tol-Pal system protein TolA-like [Aegilops tauschii subsp. strangulata]
MPEGTVVAATVFEPSSVRECGRGGWAEVVIPDWEVVEVEDDTPPRAGVVERVGTDGGGGGIILEETLRAAVSEAPPVLEEAPRAAVPEATSAAGPETVTRGVPASGPETATQGVPASGSSSALAASRAASGEYALVARQGGRRATVPQPARCGGAVVFGPQTPEEAALDAVSRRLRGRTEQLEAFAKAEVERTRDLERVVLHLDAFRVAAYNRLLGKHQELMEQLAAKEEELRVAAAEAEVDLLRGQVTTTEGARQDEARRREAAEKAAEDKDAELKVALAKAADLEKALEERDHAIERERRGTLLEAQHLEESFSRAFPETQRLAEEAVRYQRDPTGVAGSGTDPRVAWAFPEIIAIAQARLQVLGT